MFIGRYFASATAMAVALGGIALPVTALFAAADKVQIEVTGNLVPSCGNSGTTLSVDAGDLTKAGSVTFAFTVDCNAPFQYTMHSGNGALRLVDAPAGLKREQIELPYEVSFSIPLTRGEAIKDTCKSTALRQGAVNCKFTNSGSKVALNQTATGQISWEAPSQQLAAGKYKDQLTISITARV